MSSETRLWLIRHARVDGDRAVIHPSHAPADVSDRDQFARLRQELPETHAAICSPARRTRDTAMALGLNASIDPAYREQDFGDWTGRTHAAIRQDDPFAYDAFWRTPGSNKPPGGESFSDQIARVCDGLSSLPEGDVILVVHSGTIRALLAIALGITAENALRFVIDPVSLTRIDRIGDAWRVISVNVRP